jgi:hypothetical protein
MQKIRVGNDILQFPDDMDDNAIKAVIQKEYGGLQLQKQPTQAMQTSQQEQPDAVMNGKRYKTQDFTDAQKKEMDAFKVSGATQGESSPYRDYSPYSPLGYADMAMSDTVTGASQLGAYGLKALGKGADYLANKVGYNPDLENKLDYTGKFDKVAQGQQADFEKNYGTGLTPALIRGGAGILAPIGAIGKVDDALNAGKQILKSGIKSKLAGAGKLVKSSAIGAGLTPYVTSDKESGDLSSFAQRKAIDTAVGVAGGAIAKGAGAVGRQIVPKVDKNIKNLAKIAIDKFKLPLRLDQINPSRVRNTVQKVSQEIPFSGVDAQETALKTTWNKAVAGTMGIEDLTPDSIKSFRTKNSKMFNDVLDGVDVKFSTDDAKRINNIIYEATDKLGDNSDALNVVKKQIKNVNVNLQTEKKASSIVDKYGNPMEIKEIQKKLNGQKLSSIRSDLVLSMPDFDPKARKYVSKIIDVIDDIASKNLSPEKSAQLAIARQQYKYYKTIQSLLKKSPDGELNPTDLINKVGANDFIPSDKISTGEDDLVDLARIAKQFLPKKGGSDTFQKSALAGVGGASIYNPTAIPIAGGTFAVNRAYQKGINQNPKYVAKSIAGQSGINTLDAISNNADTIASQSSRMTGQAMNAMSNPQSEIQQSQPQRRTIDDIKRGFYEKKQNTVTDTDTRMQDILKRIRTQKPQASNQTQYEQRGLRNNNPLNIEHNANNDWQGQSSTDGRFAQFETPEHGLRAGFKLLKNYEKNGNNTITKILNRFAPNNENNTKQYISFVARKMGISPNDKINMKSQTQARELLKAIITMENGDMPYDDKTINKSYLMALRT